MSLGNCLNPSSRSSPATNRTCSCLVMRTFLPERKLFPEGDFPQFAFLHLSGWPAGCIAAQGLLPELTDRTDLPEFLQIVWGFPFVYPDHPEGQNRGDISMERECANLEALQVAQASKNCSSLLRPWQIRNGIDHASS